MLTNNALFAKIEEGRGRFYEIPCKLYERRCAVRRKDKLPELLAPAGSIDALFAAVSAGADAVYVGGKSFGARAYAKNFDMDELAFATRYCHVHGVKIYVTVNTLIYDKELPALSDYALELYKMGVDAIIATDLGAISEIRRRVPELEIHASTQMSVHNTLGAEVAASLGCKRVVLARELSLDDINSVTDTASVETEIFLHGALCVCHSGQCLMSSLVGGRSGNRGECAQPCRLPYNDGRYPMSLSDLSLASHIPELICSGVSSLKIEGRMKSPDYVYTVTSIYRKLLDEGRRANAKECEKLRAAFSRGGFTDGYFVNNKNGKMTGVRDEEDKIKTRMQEQYTPEIIKRSVKAHFVARRGEQLKLTLSLPWRSVTVTGDEPSPAISSPLTEREAAERISKLGQTLFSLKDEDITLEIDEGINIPPAKLNALRREAAEKLEYTGRNAPDTAPYQRPLKRDSEGSLKTALFLNGSVYRDMRSRAEHFWFDIVFLPLADYDGTAEGVYIPPIVFDSEMRAVREQLSEAVELGAIYALISNISHIPLAREFGLKPIGDFRLNITNTLTRMEYERLGISRAILSPELTLPQARDIGGGEIIYGRIPLMITERCLMREIADCKACGEVSLTDRYGEKFPIMRESGHRNLILNSVVTYMGDKKELLYEAGINHLHLIFTTEDYEEATAAAAAARKGFALRAHSTVRRIGKRN